MQKVKKNYIFTHGNPSEAKHVSKLGHSLAILDVGHGNCAVLIDTNGVVVIDTGPGSSLLEYLTERSVKIVDVILISHADQDHIGGLVQLLASKVFCIKRVLLNTDSEKDTAVWDDLLYELNRANNANELQFEISLTHNRSGEFDQGAVNIEILGPSKYLAGKGPGSKDKKGRKITTNSISAVIRLSKDKNPIALLPGDLDEVGLTDLIGSGVNLNAPLVVFPHHGGRAGSTNMAEFARKLCTQVSPKWLFSQTVVVSMEHLTPRLLRRFDSERHLSGLHARSCPSIAQNRFPPLYLHI